MAIRPTTQEDRANIVPDALSVLNEQGVTWQERWTLKNLASSPQAALDYLAGLGYEVVPYGSGWNFAVRNPKGDGQWRVVDPSGLADTVNDLYDLTVDIVQGAAVDYFARLGGGAAGAIMGASGGSTGSFLGGLAGQAAGAAGAGYLTQRLRQEVGAAAGIPGNTDQQQAVNVGVASGLGVPMMAGAQNLARLGGAVTKAVGGYTRELGAKLAKTKDIPGVGSPADVISYRARTMPRQLMEPTEALAIMRAQNNKVLAGTAEKKIADALLDAAADTGATVDMRPVLDFLKNESLPLDALPPDYSAVSTYTGYIEDVLRRNASRFGWKPKVETRIVRDPLGVATEVPVQSLDWEHVPVNLANVARQAIDDLADFANPMTSTAFTQTQAASGAAGKARRLLRERIEAAMTGVTDAQGRSFGDLQRIASVKIGTAKALQKRIGSGDPELDTEDVVTSAHSWLRGVGQQEGQEPARQTLRNYDRVQGTNFADVAEEVAVAGQFENPGGMPGQRPQITPTGQVLGYSLATSGLTGAIVGGMTGGLQGAVLGGALPIALGVGGIALSTERGIVGAFRGGQAMQEVLNRAGRAAAPAVPAMAGATRASSYAALQDLARRELERRRQESDLLTAAP